MRTVTGLYRCTPPDMFVHDHDMTAGLLARGSVPSTAFPVSQWLYGVRLAAHSCGGSRGIGREPVPRSLLIPEGNRQLQSYTDFALRQRVLLCKS